ncbi:unnamed protein product [Eretmochelys imbricata]
MWYSPCSHAQPSPCITGNETGANYIRRIIFNPQTIGAGITLFPFQPNPGGTFSDSGRQCCVEGEGIANATSGSRGSSFSSAHIGGKREHWLLFILFYGGGPGLSSERKEQPWGGTLTVALMLVGKKPGMLSSSLACSTQKA